ncbi:PaaI family thioesterase [Alkalicoccus urumqiensis]|uniref:PaaI family thioesterase n=1 Tax=Alkalicoccus urumqiensis TaxID=1548213 RepID=A0A2P6MF95_ALKUR|nr:PaaI family thioesterase [Alkalicoccus urumqiensis]PRO64975.1 PaaI family thioesterase [Alkalicoccus urumqiensis]
MEDKQLIRKVEEAARAHKDGSPDVFLYSLFDFAFDYDAENEEVRMQIPINELMYNPVGFIHGGVMLYIADTAMGHLCAAFNEAPSVSLELNSQFLRTAKKGTLHARASFLKKGRSVQYAECDIKDEEGKLLTKITGTFYTLPDAQG